VKHTKKLLALLLALIFALGASITVMADIEPEGPPKQFGITAQPQAQTVAYGEKFTLSVSVQYATGTTTMDITYEWKYREVGAKEYTLITGSNQKESITGGEKSTLEIVSTDDWYPTGGKAVLASVREYVCVLKIKKGNNTEEVKSAEVKVTVQGLDDEEARNEFLYKDPVTEAKAALEKAITFDGLKFLVYVFYPIGLMYSFFRNVRALNEGWDNTRFYA